MKKNNHSMFPLVLLVLNLCSVLMAVVYEGDLSRDGKVDIDDMSELSVDWLSSYNMLAFNDVSRDWEKNDGAAQWVVDLFSDNEGTGYSGWLEVGGAGLYNEVNRRLEWNLGNNEVNHKILNDRVVEADILNIQVDVSAIDSVGTFYIYFLYQDENNWYRLKVDDNDGSGSSLFQKKIGGSMSDIGSAGDVVDILGNQALVHWQIVADISGGSLKFVSESNEYVSATDNIEFTSGMVGLGGNKRRPLWDNFRVNRTDADLEDGYELWLRYHKIQNSSVLAGYKGQVKQLVVQGSSEVFTALSEELDNGVDGLFGVDIPVVGSVTADNAVVVGAAGSSAVIDSLGLGSVLSVIGEQGYVIRSASYDNKSIIAIAANTDVGALYGTFHFLRLLQTNADISYLAIQEKPKIKRRLLNHWDGLDGGASRGYMGNSIWRYDELPDVVSPRYKDYARACSSVGINGMVPNNVNASSTSLTTEYIEKLAAIADVLRPYGVRVYLTAKFSAPMDIGGLNTADPLDSSVISWWDDKANEIYEMIPDFGGFLVKANSEGQPGPKDYGRTHVDGANMMANALDEHGGVVMWRAFVYDTSIDPDRAKHAYMEFKPLDGQFKDNVIIQIKNGPLDFQPLEPFTPLFGKYESTNYGAELEILQEYTGRSTHLNYLGRIWEVFLDTDTNAYGSGTTVGDTLDGSLSGSRETLIAGVANVGDDANWCGHHFAQANWYAFGRLGWDHKLSSADIADEWARMTWGNDETVVAIVKNMLMGSAKAAHDYFTPIGLNFLAKVADHYSPDPAAREYFHKVSSDGLGFDRTMTGSDAVSQYAPATRDMFNDAASCPDEYLLWFHHVSWDHVMQSGRTMWDELCYRYYSGAAFVTDMIEQWDSLEGVIDSNRFEHVRGRLTSQEAHAIFWRDTCVDYFQEYSGRSISNYQ